MKIWLSVYFTFINLLSIAASEYINARTGFIMVHISGTQCFQSWLLISIYLGFKLDAMYKPAVHLTIIVVIIWVSRSQQPHLSNWVFGIGTKAHTVERSMAHAVSRYFFSDTPVDELGLTKKIFEIWALKASQYSFSRERVSQLVCHNLNIIIPLIWKGKKWSNNLAGSLHVAGWILHYGRSRLKRPKRFEEKWLL